MPRRLAAALTAAALALCACAQTPQAPTQTGVCYALASAAGGKISFNVVASGVPDMEHCAAALEGMRQRFLSLGGTRDEVAGAYQGNFLFLQPDGVFTSANYDGVRYPFLVRTGDGRLVPPGAAQ